MPGSKADKQKTRAEGPPFSLWRLSLAVGCLRLRWAFGWQPAGAERPFGDARNPLVAQALTAIPGRVGPAALFSSGFLNPHPPACEHIQIRALFHNGNRLFEDRAILTPDHEDWCFLPFEGDSSDDHPLVVAEEDGRRWRREFYDRLEQTGRVFGVVLCGAPPRRFPVSPEPN